MLAFGKREEEVKGKLELNYMKEEDEKMQERCVENIERRKDSDMVSKDFKCQWIKSGTNLLQLLSPNVS